MNAHLQKWADRVDAMALRERAIVFFAAAMVLIFLFNMLLTNSVTERQRQLSRDLAQKQVDLRKLNDEMQKVVVPQGQSAEELLKSRIDNLRRRVEEVDGRLAQKQRELVPPERIPALLEEMLRRERKLELVGLRSVPPTALIQDKAPVAEAEQNRPAQAIQVYRHGVELTVRGNYFELMNYLRDLEHLPLRMFWREVEISGDDYPVITMKLSVYTLSLDRSWVVV